MQAISDSLMSPAFLQGAIDSSFETLDKKNVKFLKPRNTSNSSLQRVGIETITTSVLPKVIVPCQCKS